MLAHHFPVRRRRFMRLAATVGVLAVIGKNADPVRAATPTDVATDGTSPLIYAPRTGHHLSGAFLSWWLQHGRERVLGWPISEPFDAAGRRFQFFERGLLEHSAEVADPSRVWPLSVGRTWLAVQREAGIGSERVDGSSAFWFDQTGFGVHSEIAVIRQPEDGRRPYPVGRWQAYCRPAAISDESQALIDLASRSRRLEVRDLGS